MEYQEEIIERFKAMLAAEQRLREAESAYNLTLAPLQIEVGIAKNSVEAHTIALRDLMQDNGVVEEVIPGEAVDGNALSDYKLVFAKQPPRLVIPDESAVPDEWIKTERTVKKRELLAHLKEMDVLPNWCSIERNEPKFNWKPVKKGTDK